MSNSRSPHEFRFGHALERNDDGWACHCGVRYTGNRTAATATHREHVRSVPRPPRRKTCSAPGCHQQDRAGGLCRSHRACLDRYGSLTPPPPRTTCVEPGCDKPKGGGRLCKMHHSRLYRTGTTAPGRRAAVMPLEDRWRRDVTPGGPDECWEWQGKRAAQTGYGVCYGRGAHRVSYELHHGPIPPGMLILHSCDNRPCVNPGHLRAGTQTDNMQDALRRGRNPRWLPRPTDV